MKIGLFCQEITFITEFPGINFLLPTFLTGSKSDFQEEVCYLLLLILNTEDSQGLCILYVSGNKFENKFDDKDVIRLSYLLKNFNYLY